MLPYASFEFKTRGMVWGMMGPIDNQDTRGVLRKEKAVTGVGGGRGKKMCSCVHCEELGEFPTAEHYPVGIIGESISR